MINFERVFFKKKKEKESKLESLNFQRVSLHWLGTAVHCRAQLSLF